MGEVRPSHVHPSRPRTAVFQIKLDEEFLETVLPSMGSSVRVVKGKHRGRAGSLHSIEQDDFSCTVRFDVRCPLRARTSIPGSRCRRKIHGGHSVFSRFPQRALSLACKSI